MAGLNFDQGWQRSATGINAKVAARLESATGWKRGDGRNGAFYRSKRLASIGTQGGNGVEQSACIWMRWRVEHGGAGTHLDERAGIHHGDSIGDLRDYGQHDHPAKAHRVRGMAW